MSSLEGLHLNNAFEITSPTRWIYMLPWQEQPMFDSDGSIFGSLLDDIDHASTAYVVDYSASDPLRADIRIRWEAFLADRYQFVDEMPDGGTLWVHR
jgi:hypothetical protein